jgi:hypothetical protein
VLIVHVRFAIKGGVIANIASGLILDQIPPQFGCSCTDAETMEPLPCNTVLNWYAVCAAPCWLNWYAVRG